MRSFTNHVLLILFSCFISCSGSNRADSSETKKTTEEVKLSLACKVVNEENINLQGVKIDFYQDGKLIETKFSDSTGSCSDFENTYNYKYKVIFSKENYVSKYIEVDAKTNYIKDEFPTDGDLINVKMSMLEKKSSIDYSIITDLPIARARIDSAYGLMNYDFDFINKRKKEIDDFLSTIN